MDGIFEINRQGFFTKVEAEALLPLLYRLTEQSCRDVKRLMQVLEALPDKKSERALDLEQQIDSGIDRWQKKVVRLGAIPKGLWLVDFDSGEGYFCWKFPEVQIRYCHGYQDGFSGRKLIADTSGELI